MEIAMTMAQMSISGAVLIIAIILIRTLTINRLPKQTFLMLWSLALIRLLIPFVIPSPFSIYSVIFRNMPVEMLSELPSGILFTETPADETSQAYTQIHPASLENDYKLSLADTTDVATSTPLKTDARGPAEPVSPDILPQFQEQTGLSAQNISPQQNISAHKENPATVFSFVMSTWATLRLTGPVIFIIWCTGAVLCISFFVVTYLRCRLEFRTSLPVTNTYVNHWLESRHIRRYLSVRQSDRVNTPLTYGILHPVILLPRQTDWTDTLKLQYVLSHEYVHIRRLDAVTKLLIALTLCLHWFNPLVWVMYFLFNRDLELACDEKVIRHFGESSRSAYARMLIDMEEKKSGLMPLCNNFSKNAIEERITAIMKLKKISRPVTLLAMGLIIGVATLFVTSASYASSANSTDDVSGHPGNAVYMPDSSFTKEEYDALLALQFEDFMDMTISEYQEKIWSVTDTMEYMSLLERFSQSTTLLDLRYANETASFLFNILEPLTAGGGKWKTRDYGGYAATSFSGTSDNASLEYNIFLTIEDPDVLTVGEYDASRQGMMTGMEQLLEDRTIEQLKDEEYMQDEILAGINSLEQKWGSDRLSIDVEYAFLPLNPDFTASDATSTSAIESGPQRKELSDDYESAIDPQANTKTQLQKETQRLIQMQEEKESRINANATADDYHSLFTLMTPGYRDMSAADFDNALLDWGNDHYDSYERIREDDFLDDFQIDLSEEELSFVRLTMALSGEENYRMVQSLKTGCPKEDPVYRSCRFNRAEEDGLIWCGFDYAFSYHLADEDNITVGERDRLIGGVIQDIEAFWTDTDLEDLLKLTRGDVLEKLEAIAGRYSNRKVSITILEDHLYFEHMNERAYAKR